SFFTCLLLPRPLHSFPTRRSSDLIAVPSAPHAALLRTISQRPLSDCLCSLRACCLPLWPETLLCAFHLRSSACKCRLHYFARCLDRKSTRLNSSHRTTSYAVFCLK